MFILKSTKSFDNEYLKLIKRDKKLENKIIKILKIIANNPFDNCLKTHKVNTRNLGIKFSSRINGDLRVIWDFDERNNLILVLLDIGGHSGNRKVYN